MIHFEVILHQLEVGRKIQDKYFFVKIDVLYGLMYNCLLELRGVDQHCLERIL